LKVDRFGFIINSLYLTFYYFMSS